MFTEEEYEKLIDMIRMVGQDEFAEMDESTIKKWIDFVKPMVSKKQFGNLYYQAIALLVAHKLKMAGLGENSLGEMGKIGNSFVASSVSDGGSSISFAGGGTGNLQADAEYALTVYGTQYLQLRRMVVVPIHVSGEDSCYAWV